VFALSLGGQGQVLGGEPLHALGLVLGATDHLMGRILGPLVPQHTDEDIRGRSWLQRFAVGGLRVGVVVGVNVETVGLLAAVAET
jgi:hypothetical protein